MARWVWPAAAGVVASTTGVVINLATDLATNAWAWVAVVVLTALGVVVGMRVQPAAAGPAAAPEVRPQPSVHNSVSGTVHGGVVQAGNLDSVTIHSPTTINQNAVARDGGTVYQAGRDVNPNP
ncbi:hypothetical protein [Saccharothrix syringae]|uniref:Uncharacterized protein n=1 Tax=Saccharothrix syringae TaxID=103733 RepID=A0A5Q0H9M7_SACSY|nr:hypothetical protein [Saccharothrix syringae]QFZ22644.1 hypothetical protein EKG83_39115 [Saccharothrix syringae]